MSTAVTTAWPSTCSTFARIPMIAAARTKYMVVVREEQYCTFEGMLRFLTQQARRKRIEGILSENMNVLGSDKGVTLDELLNRGETGNIMGI